MSKRKSLRRKNLRPVMLAMYDEEGFLDAHEVQPRAEQGKFVLVDTYDGWRIFHRPSGLRLPAAFRTVEFAEEVLRHLPEPNGSFPSCLKATRESARHHLDRVPENEKERYIAVFRSMGMTRRGSTWAQW